MLFNDILSKGFDGHHFVMGLASHFRDLLVCKNPETIELLEVGEQVKAMYLEQSKSTRHSFLIESIEIANTCDLKYKTSRNQRLLVELCLMQLASITFEASEKKKPNLNLSENSEPFVIPPSYFSKENNELAIDKNVLAIVSETKTESISEKPGTPDKLKDSEETSVKPEAPPQVNPQLIAERNAKKVSALSLKSIQKKKQLQEDLAANKPDNIDLPTEEFTKKEMVSAWNQYAKKIEKEGKFNLLSHLTMGIPKLQDNIIHLEYPNTTIKVEVERAKHDLLSYLKESLQNYDIDLDITVNETAEKRYAYTPREKFEKLKEKNPLIETLRKEFDLDV